MSKVRERTDRTARLLKLQILLWQYPQGVKIKELANICATSKKTIYRDLKTLEEQLHVPIWEDGSKRGIVDGYFLPPINFTQEEAVNLFLAVRLMQHLFHLYNPSVASTFMKLDVIVPAPLRLQIQKTLEYIHSQPRDERKIRNFDKLTQAWLSQHRVRISYQDILEEKPLEQYIEPYFIEPSAPDHACYVIAYSVEKKLVTNFKIDRIIGEVRLESDTYEIPSSFNIYDYLNSSLDVHVDEELVTVKLHFNHVASRTVKTTIWHPSQTIDVQEDGSTIIKLNVRNNYGLRAWILGWGDQVEVLEPQSLRDQILETVNALQMKYAHK